MKPEQLPDFFQSLIDEGKDLLEVATVANHKAREVMAQGRAPSRQDLESAVKPQHRAMLDKHLKKLGV